MFIIYIWVVLIVPGIKTMGQWAAWLSENDVNWLLLGFPIGLSAWLEMCLPNPILNNDVRSR